MDRPRPAETWFGLLARLRARIHTTLLSRELGSRGSGTVICPPLRFANLRFIHLGNDVTINRDCWIHVLTPNPGEPAPQLRIGDRSSIGMGATISAAQEVVLGRRVVLARNVYISDHRHAYEDAAVAILDQGITDVRPTSIGDDTWLGQNVCVLAGVRIGQHCVIGSNSTVTADIPDYSVAVGSPARVIKRYSFERKRWVSTRPATPGHAPHVEHRASIGD